MRSGLFMQLVLLCATSICLTGNLAAQSLRDDTIRGGSSSTSSSEEASDEDASEIDGGPASDDPSEMDVEPAIADPSEPDGEPASDEPTETDVAPDDADARPKVARQSLLSEPEPAEAGWISLHDYPSDSQPPIGLRDIFPLFSGDASLQDVAPVSEELRPQGLVIFLNYDSFCGVPDGGWNNSGLRTGFNFASRLGQFSEVTGFGLQAGASVGVYDWAGTDYRLQHQNRAETQGFFTYGLYRKPTEDSRLVAGLVQDWSFNDTFGVFGQNPVLSQLRGQIGYAASASNEYGIMGAAHLLSSTRQVPGFGPTKWQSINYLSGYWHHKWYSTGPDTWISIGVPAHRRLTGNGSVGDYLVSASSQAPLSNAVALFSSVTYMHQSASLGGESAADEAWNFTVGISIYPRRNARTTTVAGQRWMPLMPVANNGSFLVDTNNSY